MVCKEKRNRSRWYFGGLASTGAAVLTHPLDLLKVMMQTHTKKNITLLQLAGIVVATRGIRGLFSGISAAILRQLTYSTTRFGIYEVGKQSLREEGKPLAFKTSVVLAGVSGFIGGFVGSPADLINVRMQNDMKLPPEKRHNYKNVFHGLYLVVKESGVMRLWQGSLLNCTRAAVMTIGQLSFYDQSKALLLAVPFMGDDIFTHISSSIMAGAIATTMCQPIDVAKTRIMSLKKGENRTIVYNIQKIILEGPKALFKGYIPAFLRLAPHTIITFVFLEQMRIHLGIRVKPPACPKIDVKKRRIH